MKGVGIALVLVAHLLIPGAAGAYQWPASDARVVKGFGQESGGRLEVGVEIVTADATVRPLEHGEVVFRFDPARPTGTLPRGLGAHLVLQHAERVRSVYAHLESGSVSLAATIGPGESVGRVGETGSARGRVLGLSILDTETSTYLNPLVVLPPLPDRQAPVIGRVFLRRQGEALVEIGRSPYATLSGTAEVVVEAYDLREDVPYRWRIVPFALSLSVNGRETDGLQFGSIQSNGDLLQEDGSRRGAGAVYAEAWLYRLGSIQLQRGETRLEILVRDFAGNESTRALVLSIGG